MANTILSVQDLSKVYRSYPTPWARLSELLTGRVRHQAFHALEGVSFSQETGEGLALIGENGAGKSTLLKILAGITAPTSGAVSVRGTVASILELGSSFHPELTGRQNIVLNAAMLGLDEEQVRDKTPGIIDFSELGRFIDQPVKTYSTGMSMRLGFAIATEVEPDILIIDEALSVGDGYFQKKCMDRMGEFVAEGGTLLFCSHAMYYVSHFCRRGLWLREGRMEALGPVDEVVREYEVFLASKREAKKVKSRPETAPPPTAERPARFTAIGIHGGTGRPPVFRLGDPLEMEIRIHAQSPDLPLHVGVGIDRSDGVEVTAMATHLAGVDVLSGARDYRLRLTLPRLPLVKGDYSFHAFLLDEKGLHVYDEWVDPTAFQVKSADYRFGLVEVDHAWEVAAAGKPASGTVEGPEPEATKPETWSRASVGVSSGTS